MTRELLEYAEQFMRLGYRIAQENVYLNGCVEAVLMWKDANAELEKAVEEMKKATLGQESSQIEFDWDKTIYDE